MIGPATGVTLSIRGPWWHSLLWYSAGWRNDRRALDRYLLLPDPGRCHAHVSSRMPRGAICRHGCCGSQPRQYSRARGGSQQRSAPPVGASPPSLTSTCASLSLGSASARVPLRAVPSCLSLSSSSGHHVSQQHGFQSSIESLYRKHHPALVTFSRMNGDTGLPSDHSCYVTCVLLL